MWHNMFRKVLARFIREKPSGINDMWYHLREDAERLYTEE